MSGERYATVGHSISMKQRKVGIWFVGAWGGVASTAALGLAALQRSLADGTALVTATPLFDNLDLDGFGGFVIGGHDIRKSSYLQAVRELHERSGVFDHGLIETCKDDLAAWDGNVRPGSILGAGPTISKLANLRETQQGETPRQVVERLQADLREFQSKHGLEQMVLVSVASTEPPFLPDAGFESVKKFRGTLEDRAARIPASALYAWAGIDLGWPYLNFTPSLGASFPAALELAREKRVPVAGKDG